MTLRGTATNLFGFRQHLSIELQIITGHVIYNIPYKYRPDENDPYDNCNFADQLKPRGLAYYDPGGAVSLLQLRSYSLMRGIEDF